MFPESLCGGRFVSIRVSARKRPCFSLQDRAASSGRDHPQASAPSRLLQARTCCRRKHCYSFSSCIPLTRPQHLVCSRRGARLKGPSSRDEGDEGKPRPRRGQASPRHCKEPNPKQRVHRPATRATRASLALVLQGARSYCKERADPGDEGKPRPCEAPSPRHCKEPDPRADP